VWALDVEASTPDGALAAAWEAIDPCSSCQRPAVAASAPLADGREGVALTLGPDEEGRTGSALVVYVDDAARVLLVRQSPQAVLPARVESDLARMEASFHGLPSQDAGA